MRFEDHWQNYYISKSTSTFTVAPFKMALNSHLECERRKQKIRTFEKCNKKEEEYLCNIHLFFDLIHVAFRDNQRRSGHGRVWHVWPVRSSRPPTAVVTSRERQEWEGLQDWGLLLAQAFQSRHSRQKLDSPDKPAARQHSHHTPGKKSK